MLTGMYPGCLPGSMCTPAPQRRNKQRRGGRGVSKRGDAVGPVGGGKDPSVAVPYSRSRAASSAASGPGTPLFGERPAGLSQLLALHGPRVASSPGSDTSSLHSYRATSLSGYSLSSAPSFSAAMSQPAASIPSPAPFNPAAAATMPDPSERSERCSYAESTKPYPGTVHTPWIRNVPLSEGVPVGDEVVAFGDFLKPTPEEQKRCEILCCAVSAAARRLWHPATAKLVGSRAFGCALPSSDTNVVVESCGLTCAELAEGIQAVGTYSARVDASADGEQFVVVLGADGQPECRVELHAGERSPARQLSQLLRRRLEAHGGAGRAVAAVIRTVLRQSNLQGPGKGGLSGTAIAVMVAAALASIEADLIEATRDSPKSPPSPAAVAEQLLQRVLATYGKWDWGSRSVGIDACFGGRMHAERYAASVCSPFSTANLAADCTKPKQTSAMLEYSRLALRRWEEADPSDVTLNSRGVTPLSAIVAHKDLWDRSHQLRRRQACNIGSPGAAAAPAATPRSPPSEQDACLSPAVSPSDVTVLAACALP